MKSLLGFSQLSVICLSIALVPGAVTAQEAGGRPGDNGFQKVVSLPNAARAFLSNQSVGADASPVRKFVAESHQSSATSDQPAQSGGPPLPPAHAHRTVPAPPPPAPPPCPGVGGGCQLLVVGHSGPGTILESLRDPNNPDAPGGGFGDFGACSFGRELFQLPHHLLTSCFYEDFHAWLAV